MFYLFLAKSAWTRPFNDYSLLLLYYYYIIIVILSVMPSD